MKADSESQCAQYTDKIKFANTVSLSTLERASGPRRRRRAAAAVPAARERDEEQRRGDGCSTNILNHSIQFWNCGGLFIFNASPDQIVATTVQCRATLTNQSLNVNFQCTVNKYVDPGVASVQSVRCAIAVKCERVVHKEASCGKSNCINKFVEAFIIK